MVLTPSVRNTRRSWGELRVVVPNEGPNRSGAVVEVGAQVRVCWVAPISESKRRLPF